ncbi:Uncharacterised protein [uncultured Eubacterium sp.]|nr:Uncharacterised protein [uncultured Eubacterium sp.]
MKSKKSFCNISAVLVKRNLKRFWLIPFAAFLAYFIKGVLPLIVKSSKYENLRYLTDDALSNHDYVYLGVLMVLPICASIAVFSYLHGNAPATAMHAMPFSRKKLYRSSVLSGLIMILLPVLFIGACYAVLLRGDAYELGPEALPSWIIRTLISAFFVYAVSTLAAVVAGSIVTHILLAMFFNGLLPITIYIINRFTYAFLFGYANSPLASSILSPVSFERSSYGSFFNGDTLLIYLAYLLFAFILIWCSAAAYRRLPLEKEGNATVITWLGEIVCILFAFVGTIIFGFFIAYWGGEMINLLPLLIGSLVSSFLFYIIARMILEKSLAVFRPTVFKKYTAVLVAVALFFGLTVFDLTGYTTKVPEAGAVKSVTLDDDFLQTGIFQDSFSSEIILTEKENIQNLIEFHRLLVENKGDLTERSDAPYYFNINYHLNDGKEIKRTYRISMDGQKTLLDAYGKIFESREYKHLTLDNIKRAQTSDFRLMDKGGAILLKKLPDSFMHKLKDALLEDYDAMTFTQAVAIRSKDPDYVLNYTTNYADVPDAVREDVLNIYKKTCPRVYSLLAETLQ